MQCIMQVLCNQFLRINRHKNTIHFILNIISVCFSTFNVFYFLKIVMLLLVIYKEKTDIKNLYLNILNAIKKLFKAYYKTTMKGEKYS